MIDRILIGSRAANYWWPKSVFDRDDSDWDFMSFYSMRNAIRTPRQEYHYEPEFTIFAEKFLRYGYRSNQLGCLVADPDLLYTLKVSHSFWDVHWQKTITHIRCMKKLGCAIIPELYDILYATWERVHGKKQVNLNVPNEQFFTHYVKRQVDHDALHELFKTGDVPKYKTLKKDPSKAMISRELFFAQPYEEQLNTVREEMCVLGAERYLMTGLTTSPGVAVRSALKLLVTSASKGWFPLFIVDNWDKVLESKLPPQLKMIKDVE